jgi:hypothetical protein
MLQDLRWAIRLAIRNRALTLVIVLSLALGIGANTTIFTLLNTLFLNPLPVEKPSELVAVLTVASRNATQFGNLLPLSYPNLKDFRERIACSADSPATRRRSRSACRRRERRANRSVCSRSS